MTAEGPSCQRPSLPFPAHSVPPAPRSRVPRAAGSIRAPETPCPAPPAQNVGRITLCPRCWVWTCVPWRIFGRNCEANASGGARPWPTPCAPRHATAHSCTRLPDWRPLPAARRLRCPDPSPPSEGSGAPPGGFSVDARSRGSPPSTCTYTHVLWITRFLDFPSLSPGVPCVSPAPPLLPGPPLRLSPPLAFSWFTPSLCWPLSCSSFARKGSRKVVSVASLLNGSLTEF